MAPLSSETEDHYLSDESDFYGNDDTKAELEARVADFDLSAWWAKKKPSLAMIAAENIASKKAEESVREKAVLYNIYEGVPGARQLGQSVEEFLEKFPPSTTPLSDWMPWIWIANPYLTRKSFKGERNSTAELARCGQELLEDFVSVKAVLEYENRGKPPTLVTKQVNKLREETAKKIREMAIKLHETSGKWMLFPSAEYVDSVWSTVARATAENELGTAAKVAPDDGDVRKGRLICIYTADFSDTEDVTRVLHKLRDLGLVDGRRYIYYKCDAYTHLGLNSGNDYGIKPSLYSSADLLKPKRTLDQYLKKGGKVA